MQILVLKKDRYLDTFDNLTAERVTIQELILLLSECNELIHLFTSREQTHRSRGTALEQHLIESLSLGPYHV